MKEESESRSPSGQVPRVIDLSQAPGERKAWDKPRLIVYLWALVELLLVSNPFQISSSLRVKALQLFGAEIGTGVIFRPRTRVKFPWKLHVGDRCWIGEGVWIHNQDHVYVGSDVVLSQDAFLTTGSHSVRTDMGLVTKPIRIGNGAWITSRCIVLGGATIGEAAIITPNTVVRTGLYVPPESIFGQPDPQILGSRYKPSLAENESGDRN
ncbi:hypothetical protein ARGLB_064_00990 [Arthrobacter globiformis NBRC 12137]|uniref:Acetyltransferase n=1 Tax=Arthrobacter globiformis (strain ATCC 8010 / DSM 20124 / JCM 1332 / NBRC 12137 / NCIMB 8907 / NRRL B-2979 / 168) TaxID=1077972 RepID=H0QND5_ARTG1|nr:hypothetical protein ARGLB_064_00990 [Arthrobacter globiformis NBRC 12137]